MMGENLHHAQAIILKELIFHNGAKFSELNKTGLENDHFTFHLKQLIKDGLVEKQGLRYFLTQKGKRIAGNLDTEKLKMENFGKVSVIMAGKRVKDGKTEYLIQQRLKTQFYGHWGFMTGKVRFGDTTEATATREFKEECGLEGKPRFLGVHHRLRGPSMKEIVLDNYFFVYVFENPQGELMDSAEGKNRWMEEKGLKGLQTFPGFTETMRLVKDEKGEFKEQFFEVKEI